MAHSAYKVATIPVEESIGHVLADPRRRRYLGQPHVAIDYMTSVTGEFLQPDLLNFDVLTLNNCGFSKARTLGEDTRMLWFYIEPSDECREAVKV